MNGSPTIFMVTIVSDVNSISTMDMHPEFWISISVWPWNERLPGVVGPNRIESRVKTHVTLL